MARTELPLGEEKARAVMAMFDTIARRYDLVNRVMTFGMDRGWRRRTVRSLALAPGSVVVDLACGTGDLCAELRRAGMHAVGVDISAGMLARAHGSSPLVLGDVTALPLGAACADGAVSGFALRNVAALGAFLAEAARVVRPGGRIGLLEVATPPGALLGAAHRLYFSRVVPLIGAALSDAAAYRYLPRSVAYLPEPAELLEMVRAAGFPDARREPLCLGAVQLLTGTRAAAGASP